MNIFFELIIKNIFNPASAAQHPEKLKIRSETVNYINTKLSIQKANNMVWLRAIQRSWHFISSPGSASIPFIRFFMGYSFQAEPIRGELYQVYCVFVLAGAIS